MVVFKAGEWILLFSKEGKNVIFKLEEGIQKVSTIGVFEAGNFAEKEPGDTISLGGKEFIAFRPSIVDNIENIRRRTQIITPKDCALIAFYCDIKHGDVVVEGGTGSGSLTMALAHAVHPGGRVISYERREDNAKGAKKNVRRTGLDGVVEIKVGDVTERVDEENVDAFILDIPTPWEAVETSRKTLKGGGHFCSYSPTVNQMEKTVKELRKSGFEGIRSIETLQREMIVGELGSRPSFEMLGHTGYITIARKISD